ncbi:hypothetical protein D9Q98_007195 [Chlorella vulgaris]|uniref:Protein CASP n=1 Tax=Chlorella vulgaris TaxID=3077 RepID=A0A9D4YUQ3_CHLVU|nr:hypothetical protein D9Q98_007195 [Chlorella vulgaris]
MERKRTSMRDLANAGDVLPTVVQSFWKEFDLEGLRSKLDEQGLSVANAQEASVASRRVLAERTKDFRRHAAQEVSKEVGPLLKAYQEEVDRLTTRAKAAEGSFLELYQRLYEAPDPAPALAAGLELASRATQLEAEATKMAQELAEYKQESTELKNQDFTIRKMEERARELEAQLEERDRQLAEQQKSAEAEMQERLVLEMQEREGRLSEELSQAQGNLELLRRLHQASQNQLFSMQSRSEEAAAGLQSELELATDEMERSQQRMATLEQEKASLLARLQQQQQQGGGDGDGEAGAVAAGPAGGGGRLAEDSLRQELYAQRELATRLQSEVSSLRQQLESEAATWASRCDGLRSSLAAKEAHAGALEQELSSRPTQQQVEDLRQQMRILQAVSGYAAEDSEGEEQEQQQGAGGGGTAAGAAAAPAGRGALEAALVAKSRHLEHRLTTLRLELAEARGEAESAAARATELEAGLVQQKELVARLEEDLLAAEGSGGGGAGGSGAMDVAAGGGGGDGDGGGEQTMVGVLCSQRDRFRARAQELEAHLAAVGQELKKVRADSEAMRADNLALAERLKFVQGYQSGSGSGVRRNAAAQGGAPAVGDVEAGTIVSKYMQQYEQSINPFADFKAKEREARRKQLPIQDKAMYGVANLISGNSVARSAIFFYALALHAVIFLILARTSHHQVAHLEDLEETCLRLQHSHLAGSGGGDGTLTADHREATMGDATARDMVVATVGHAAEAVGRLLRR